MIELHDVTKVYRSGRGQVPSVRGVSLRVAAGEFVSIMGPSGSGKSTLLHLMGGLETATTGSVQFGDVDLAQLSDRDLSQLRLRQFGFVFQFFNLLPTLTAAENVALPLQLDGIGRARSRERAQAALDRLGLSDRASHYPDTLSGGEMQRVAIARALVTEPALVLCDEPTGSLDSAAGHEVLELLRRLPEQGRRSVVMVTHDPQAAAFGDRVIHVRDGLIEAGQPTRGRHAHVALDA
ncbi:MAG TPA: ABC transporter ATP-binding protein [Isosphaeraceae bacterium]|nr:ABC transporter ATP-binding protein [Isosphaeraceae bacterium]